MSDTVETVEKIEEPVDTGREDIEKLKLELAETKNKLNEAITTRQAAKEKERKSAEALGDYEKAKQLLEEKLAEQESKLKDYDTLMEIKNKYLAIETAERTELLNLIPPDLQEDLKDVSLDVLKKVASKFSTPNTTVHKGGAATSGVGKSWKDMNGAERVEMMRNTPELAKKLIKESNKL